MIIIINDSWLTLKRLLLWVRIAKVWVRIHNVYAWEKRNACFRCWNVVTEQLQEKYIPVSARVTQQLKFMPVSARMTAVQEWPLCKNWSSAIVWRTACLSQGHTPTQDQLAASEAKCKVHPVGRRVPLALLSFSSSRRHLAICPHPSTNENRSCPTAAPVSPSKLGTTNRQPRRNFSPCIRWPVPCTSRDPFSRCCLQQRRASCTTEQRSWTPSLQHRPGMVTAQHMSTQGVAPVTMIWFKVMHTLTSSRILSRCVLAWDWISVSESVSLFNRLRRRIQCFVCMLKLTALSHCLSG